MRRKSPRKEQETPAPLQRRLTRSMSLQNLSGRRNSACRSIRRRRRRGINGSSQAAGSKCRKTYSTRPQSRHNFPGLESDTFGLIQETIAHNLYFLVIQAILWNQTSGFAARPIFFALIQKYSCPEHLSQASVTELTALLRPLGLHNIRARRCIALAECWNKDPPTAERQYCRKGYPSSPVPPNTSLEYEIAHLPGIGPYALDSFRIFHRDEMRGLAKDWLGTGAICEGFEPEWKRVRPQDKELRAYLKWRWLKEGIAWDG